MDNEKTTTDPFDQKQSSNKSDTSLQVNHMKILFRSKLTIIFILLIVITFGLIGYKIYQQIKAQKQITQKTVIKQVVVRRSKIPNVILRATTAKAIDVKTGKAIKATTVFSIEDKTIYLTLDLNKSKPGTNIDYIRYLDGHYVDHGNVKIVKDTDNLNFNWTNTRPLGSVADGKWKIATYTNGILEKSISYVIQKNKVSYVYPDEPIYTFNKSF